MVGDSLVDLLDDRADCPDAALLCGGRTIAYSTLHAASIDVAVGLVARGVGRGDVVTLLFPNSPAFVVSYFACWRVGAIANPLNSRLSASELAALMSHAGSSLLLHGPTFAGLAQEALDQVRMRQDGDAPVHEIPTWQFEDEELPTPRGGSHLLPEAGRDDEPAALIYTSGTTARSKGVLLSHRNILADACGLAKRLGVDSAYRTLCFMPLFHCNALIFSHLSTFTVGGSVVLTTRFSASRLWDVVEEHAAHSFSCPPTVLAILLDRTPIERRTPTSLRFVKVGAAPLSEQLAHAFEDRFGVPLVQGYGMTEGTATTVMHDPRVVRPPGTVGFVLEGQQVRVVGSDGAPLPAEAVGEIQIGGDAVMLGYHRDPELTASTVVDGWLRTGDLGSVGSDGHVRLTGRQKELIIRGGENVVPLALDEVVSSHPSVQDCAVYGVPDPIWGESPVAAVVPRAGLDIENLTDFVRSRVADYEMPIEIRLVAEIPRNAVGKIQRHALAKAHVDASSLQKEGQPNA
ncbi:MAG: class I adenylate-forming enzyme family protein [Nocardioidaceae bacterium]